MGDTVLILRTCNEDLTSWGDFQWPSSGPVEASDWIPIPECGYGLHGLEEGKGSGFLLDRTQNAKWLVVEVEKSEIVSLGNKVKFPRGNVVHCGDQLSATRYLLEHGVTGPIVGGTFETSHHGHSVTGDDGLSITGHHGVATTGQRGVSIAGVEGQAKADQSGKALVGSYGKAITGAFGFSFTDRKGEARTGMDGLAVSMGGGVSISGTGGTSLSYGGLALTADYGHAFVLVSGGKGQAGAQGHVVVTSHGTAITGPMGFSEAGEYGRASSGENGMIQISYTEFPSGRRRLATGYIGEDGLEPNVLYRLDEVTHKFIKSTNQDDVETSTHE